MIVYDVVALLSISDDVQVALFYSPHLLRRPVPSPHRDHSGSRCHIKRQVSFAESDLDQVEKIAAKEVSAHRCRAKADLQSKVSQIRVEKPNFMEPCLCEASRSRGNPE